MSFAPNPLALNRIKAVLFLLGLLPALRLLVDALVWPENLGANPIELITRDLGTWALNFLLITLAVTPVRHATGWHWLIRLRRMLGLFSFFYAALHLLSYLWLDQFFDWSEIWLDILKRPFITVGMLAFMLLVPLALTSNNAMIKRLGGRAWQKLHRLAYLLSMLAVLHYIWLVKRDLTQPFIYAAILAVLLLNRLLRWQRQPASSQPAGGCRSN